MSLSPEDIRRLSQLARIDLAADAAERTRSQLNDIFNLVEQLQAVDTAGIDPLSHPLAMVQTMSLRLRDDRITETDQREIYMANAPQRENGLFLVPKVIE
jgi:aspartyl-tRNA(Asn)/glutamyl-tRNA(Gln) amidotransferase subunit C